MKTSIRFVCVCYTYYIWLNGGKPHFLISTSSIILPRYNVLIVVCNENPFSNRNSWKKAGLFIQLWIFFNTIAKHNKQNFLKISLHCVITNHVNLMNFFTFKSICLSYPLNGYFTQAWICNIMYCSFGNYLLTFQIFLVLTLPIIDHKNKFYIKI